jgi:pimeloyl-ACP methyl ester carboxylesterase
VLIGAADVRGVGGVQVGADGDRVLLGAAREHGAGKRRQPGFGRVRVGDSFGRRREQVDGVVGAGVPVCAIVNPLRGVKHDAAYVASVISQIDGPVLAVGHSYGGMIITNAVPQTTNVLGLVYVAAFAPDEGETLAGIVGRSQDSVLTSAVLEQQCPTGVGTETAGEFIIDPARFRDVFTADLPQLESDVYGLSQRPIAASALGDETGHPAWKDLPVWAAVGTGDKAAGADVVLFMAHRRCDHHRDRRFTRHHDLAARRRHRSHPDGAHGRHPADSMTA